MTSGNGTKSTIIMVLLGLLQAIVLGWAWKIDGSLSRVTTLEANYANILRMVEDIQIDVKTLIQRKR